MAKLQKARMFSLASMLSLLLVATFLPNVPIARLAAPFQLDFHTAHFIFDFLKSEELDPKNTNPAHPVFNLQNGTHLWYEIQTTGTPGISLNADQPLLTDPTSAIFVPAHLLPPDDAIPLQLDIHAGLSLKYTVEQVNTKFTSEGQFLQIVLNPYSLYPAGLDIVGYLLDWIGIDASGAAVGLMSNDGITRFKNILKSFKAFSQSALDFVALLKDFSPNFDSANVLHDAQTFLHDLINLCKDVTNAKVLGQLLSLYTGGVIPSEGILAGLQNFGKRYGVFETLVGLAQSIEDNFIVTAGYLIQQDNFPEVTLQTLSHTPTPTQTTIAGIDPFVGTWFSIPGHGNPVSNRTLVIQPDGTATYTGDAGVQCSSDPRPPCDPANGGGLNIRIVFNHVDRTTANRPTLDGTIVSGTGDRNSPKNIFPVGSTITATLTAYAYQVSFSGGSLFTLFLSDGGAFLPRIANNNPQLAQYLPYQTNSYTLLYDPVRNIYIFYYLYNPNDPDNLQTQIAKAKADAIRFIQSKGIDIHSVVIEWR